MARKDNSSKGGAKALLFLLLAIVAGGAATVLVWKAIEGYQRRLEVLRRPPDTKMAIIAARDLFQGIKITEEDIAAVEIPEKYLPHNGYVAAEHVIGRVPRERILINEFIREERLADPEEGVGLNAIIPRGMRAISINLAGGRAGSGFVNPGNIVDIIVTITPDDGSKARETHTVLQAVPVLAVNDRLKGNKTGQEAKRRLKPSVTLAVTPEEAEQVAHAEQQGEITLALRNDLDRVYTTLDGTDSKELYGETKQPKKTGSRPAATSSGPPQGTLQIIKAGKESEFKYDQ